MNYNFIIYNFSEDYYQYLTVPWSKMPNVIVKVSGINRNSFFKKLFFYHWSRRINEIVALPLKRIWFKEMYRNQFDNRLPICFVFAGGKYITESDELRKYILEQNPENKCVIYCGDLISKKGWDVERVKRECDAIITYDSGEAEKYGIYCYDKPLYGRIAPPSTPDTFDYDVYFLGFAKDRLPLIRNVYKTLTNAGFNCKFLVCGVKKEDQSDDGIDYVSPIPYAENIKYVNRSKCLLELIQGGSNTATLRREESIIYKRKLLTNYVGMKEADYYNPDNMSVFTSPETIDISFVRSPIKYDSFIEESELNPVKLLEFIEEILEKQND